MEPVLPRPNEVGVRKCTLPSKEGNSNLVIGHLDLLFTVDKPILVLTMPCLSPFRIQPSLNIGWR